MIRAGAWGWLFWRHRAAVRRGWRWGQGKDAFGRMMFYEMRAMIRDLRAELRLTSWDGVRPRVVVQSEPAASIHRR